MASKSDLIKILSSPSVLFASVLHCIAPHSHHHRCHPHHRRSVPGYFNFYCISHSILAFAGRTCHSPHVPVFLDATSTKMTESERAAIGNLIEIQLNERFRKMVYHASARFKYELNLYSANSNSASMWQSVAAWPLRLCMLCYTYTIYAWILVDSKRGSILFFGQLIFRIK